MTEEKRLRSVLVDLRQRAEDRTERIAGELEALARARRSSSDDDEHDPEGVPLSSEWSRLTGLLESSRADARQAEEAMRRLDAGEYGICVACLEPIPAARLKARPFAERCVPCAS